MESWVIRKHWSWWSKWIIGNATIAFPLKDLNSFFRLLEMSLINCKVELELKLMDHCVLSANGNDNHNSNSNNIIVL